MSRNFIPDETLIDQLLLDDTSAFEELHHRYCFSLYNYCCTKLHSPDDAKIIVRDLFIQLWENRHTLPVGFSISMHLYTEVRKAVVQCINKKLMSEEITIAEQIIPEFTLEELQKAKQPVMGQPQLVAATKKDTTEESAWAKVWPSSNLKGLKFGFRNMLNFW